MKMKPFKYCIFQQTIHMSKGNKYMKKDKQFFICFWALPFIGSTILIYKVEYMGPFVCSVVAAAVAAGCLSYVAAALLLLLQGTARLLLLLLQASLCCSTARAAPSCSAAATTVAACWGSWAGQ